jgi:hypothetical protein
MDHKKILEQVTFGKRVAEEEKEDLKYYFVRTNQWEKIYSGDIDIVYGPKGSGKSAIYSILIDSIDELFDKNVLVVSAEKPRGTPVFKNLNIDPPASEEEFVMLWKLYFALIVTNQMIEYDFRDSHSEKVIEILREINLIPKERTLKRFILNSVDYVKRLLRPDAFESEVKIDDTTGGFSGIIFRIKLNEPSPKEIENGIISVDSLLEEINKAMEANALTLWISIDRLDVAFTENPELEKSALRALFKVYLDLLPHERIQLKIFLRDDIWKRITEKGFREASHITRHTTISWTKETILNLIISRVLNNTIVPLHYDIEKDVVLANLDEQFNLFYRIFPDQVDIGEKQSKTLDWIINRVSDGKGNFAPREIIHLLNSSRDIQVKNLEIGKDSPSDEILIDRFSIKESLNPVSETRIHQTLYAEYPDLREYIEKLRDGKTEHSFETLKTFWETEDSLTKELIYRLIEMGFFVKRGTTEDTRYWIPFLYRPGLNLVQGFAE